MFTIGKLARKFGISRSTLLYYDSIGLLKPSDRTLANYRLYSDEDIKRMEMIQAYREAGLALSDISRLLDTEQESLTTVLEKRLQVINDEINRLRNQQQVIVRLLKNSNLLKSTRTLTREQWVTILKSAGLSDSDMKKWHQEFERLAPEGHQDFLESLGIPEDEIALIRRWSCQNKKNSDENGHHS